MLESMTGFAEVNDSWQGYSVRIGLKSVNGRGLNANITMNRPNIAIEEGVYRALQTTCKRGTIAAGVTILAPAVSEAGLQPILAMRKKLPQSLEPVTSELGSIVRAARISADQNTIPDAVIERCITAAGKAAKKLVTSRRQEGSRIAAEILPYAKEVQTAIKKIEKAAPALEKYIRSNYVDNINKLLDSTGISVNESDLAREVAIRCDKADIREELQRASLHIQSLIKVIRSRETRVGKQMDFLCQELSREINTMGVKIKGTEHAGAIIDIKTTMEKIREQVQNVQ